MNVLETITSMSSRSPAITAVEIEKEILSRFEAKQASTEIANFLQSISDVMSQDSVPDRAQLSLTARALSLATSSPALRLPVPVVQSIVQYYPISIWYRGVVPLVTTHLNQSDLLESLLPGLSSNSKESLFENSLVGVRLYRKFAAVDPDSARLRVAKERMAAAIQPYLTNPRSEVRDLATKAWAAVDSYGTPVSEV